MRTDQIQGISSNFALDTRIDIKIKWLTEPIDAREQNARQAFTDEMQQLANFFNQELGPQLIQAWHNVQKAKVSIGN